MSFNPQPTKEIAGETRSNVYDINLNLLAKELLVQVKILNTHLAKITDTTLTETDIDKKER